LSLLIANSLLTFYIRLVSQVLFSFSYILCRYSDSKSLLKTTGWRERIQRRGWMDEFITHMDGHPFNRGWFYLQLVSYL